MTAVQPDLFGGSALVGASRSVTREESAQCVGQTDVYALLAAEHTTADGRCTVCERYRDETWHGRCDTATL